MFKRFIYIAVLIFAVSTSAFGLFAPVYSKGGTCLTGGLPGCLDAYDGATLNDKDTAFITTGGSLYVYSLDADSGLAESSPDVIAPDTAPGLKRWILQSIAIDSTLTSIAALGTAANKGIYTTGIDTWAEFDLTSFGRSILAVADEATFKATVNLEIGTDVQGYDSDLNTIAGLSTADSNFIVGSVTGWVVESGATARTSLGLAIGSNVLAYDAGIQNLAGVAMAADRFYYTSADNTHVAGTITAVGRALLDDVTVADQATTLGLGTGDSPTHVTVKLTGLSAGYVPYHVAGATGLSNSILFTDGVKLGINTTTLGSLVNIAGDNKFIDINRTVNTAYLGIKWSTNTTNDFFIGERETTDSNFHIYNFGTSADALTILRATGNVGIGTTAPGTSKVYIKQTTDNAQSLYVEHTDADNPFGILMNFTGGSPNNFNSTFLQFQDLAKNKFMVYSNGAINAGESATTPDSGNMVWIAPSSQYFTGDGQFPIRSNINGLFYQKGVTLTGTNRGDGESDDYTRHFVLHAGIHLTDANSSATWKDNDVVAVSGFIGKDDSGAGDGHNYNTFAANFMNTISGGETTGMWGIEVDVNLQGGTVTTESKGVDVTGIWTSENLDYGVIVHPRAGSTKIVVKGFAVHDAQESFVAISPDGLTLKVESGTMKNQSAAGIETYYDTDDSMLWYTGTYDGAPTQRMELNSSGNLGVSITPSYKLDVFQASGSNTYVANFFGDGGVSNVQGIRIQAGADDAGGQTLYVDCYDGLGASVGYIENNAGTFRIVDGSDIRLKKNIVPTAINGTEILRSIEIFDFFKGANKELKTGLIANDVLPLFPSAVSVMPNGMLGLSKADLIPVLWKAAQELDERLTKLEDAQK